MMNENKGLAIFKPIFEFNRNEDFELSIDSKTFQYLIHSKNYYQFSLALTNLIREYNSTQDILKKDEISRMLRSKHGYIENYSFLSFEEQMYLESLKNYVLNLHALINNSISKNQIDYIIEIIIEKLRNGCSLSEVKNHTSINNFMVLEENQSQTSFYHPIKRVRIIVCNDGLNLNISDINNQIIIIFTSNSAVNLLNLERNTNIYNIFILEEKLVTYLPIHNPLNSAGHFFFRFYQEIRNAKVVVDDADKNEILYLQDIIHESEIQYFPRPFDPVIFEKINQIKCSAERLEKKLYYIPRSLLHNLIQCRYFLNIAKGTLKFYADMDKKINFCLTKIKRNNTLYMKANASGDWNDVAFNEENFSSILAVSLECLFYQDKYATIDCETKLGNGFTDIEVKLNKKTISVIESKVIKHGEEPDKGIAKGLDQLFHRYSENYCINGDPSIRLYLIIFTYDKRIADIESSIVKTLETYSSRNDLIFEKYLSKENLIRFSYARKSSAFDVKLRFIDIISCNLELNSKKKMHDRIKKTNFKIAERSSL